MGLEGVVGVGVMGVGVMGVEGLGWGTTPLGDISSPKDTGDWSPTEPGVPTKLYTCKHTHLIGTRVSTSPTNATH
jgi:hypothetical protein